MSGELAEKVIIVTGGANGIGRECALAYAREEATVVIVDKDLNTAEQAAAELGQQPEIRAYTDLLLHNMGPDLADGIVEGKAGPADFRTPPLWGVSASGPPYLHDGRAHDLAEAIAMHDGEARNTRLRWERLSPADRDALIRFLQTL